MKKRASVLCAIVLACAAPACKLFWDPDRFAQTEQRTTWQDHMKEARGAAEAGNNYVLQGPSELHVFYNNPEPFSYVYMIPGQWNGLGGNAYRSRDGRCLVAVQMALPEQLADFEGRTLVDRAGDHFKKDYERELGQPLVGVELRPFESERRRAMKFTAAPITQGDRQIRIPTKIIVDLDQQALVLLTVSGTSDDDALARDIIASLRTTKASEGFWAELEQLLQELTAPGASAAG